MKKQNKEKLLHNLKPKFHMYINSIVKLGFLTIFILDFINIGLVKCQTQTCGNGLREGTEGCDDGNRLNYDGCSSACVLEQIGFDCVSKMNELTLCTEKCGDSLNFKKLSVAKPCDDGNQISGDGCDSSCNQEAGWQCFGGSRTSKDSCSEICGDGYNLINTGQTGNPGGPCDDGNRINNDGCSSSCAIEFGWHCQLGGSGDTSVGSICTEDMMDGYDFGSYECDTKGNTLGCKDGIVVPGWQCSGGGFTNPDTCTEVCGDGYHYDDTAPNCDDGNTIDGDGCSFDCKQEAGFYLTQAYDFDQPQIFFEMCDGIDLGYLPCDCGNQAEHSTCPGCNFCNIAPGYKCQSAPENNPQLGSTCTEICGDGYNYAKGNSCDDGNTRSRDGCSNTCQIEFGYTCDFGSDLSPDNCFEICGDGIDLGKYECDDGNLINNDGCSSQCKINIGWTCSGGSLTTPDKCIESCGDGRNYKSFGPLSCDDGNQNNGDGCSSTCQTESGYECYGGDYNFADYCVELCGDGKRLTRELECDDGNILDNDGCDSDCFIEQGFTCSGGSSTSPDQCSEECGDGQRLTDKSHTSFCDDGNNENNDGCDLTCSVEEGYYCTGGSALQPDNCYEICGDSIDLGLNDCEDGNTNNNDGCSSTCQIEDGYDCLGGDYDTIDTCIELCGDGKNMGLNECDDGVNGVFDGCTDSCTIREGFVCIGGSRTSPDICKEKCGDSVHLKFIQGINECEDGNTNTGDGCSDQCLIEEGWTCSTDWNNNTSLTICNEICHDGKRFNSLSTYCDTNGPTEGCDAQCRVKSGYYCTGGTTSQPDTCYEICGDGFDYEQYLCDDGNNLDGDGCSKTCTLETGWDCQKPSGNTLPKGKTICQEHCGDGKNYGGNQCDDGNFNLNDGCDDQCHFEPGFTCSGGNSTSPDTCTEICGDSYDLRFYDCEDGNTDQYDGCFNCKIEHGWNCVQSTLVNTAFPGIYPIHYEITKCHDICGDGILVEQKTSQCDDSNFINGDGCSDKCQIERGYYCEGGSINSKDTCFEVCGDGFNMPMVSGDCDDYNFVNGDGCNSRCEVETGWQCTGGSPTQKDTCNEICGDGIDLGFLPCEDGNKNTGDGCDSTCQVEEGWKCSGGSGPIVDKCTDKCGDGKLMNDGVTQCDDSNDSNPLDGCHQCQILDGWTCTGGSPSSPSTCSEICGDGLYYGHFQCDDGNKDDNDGCSADCMIETGYGCNGGKPDGPDICYEICGDGFDLGLLECEDGNKRNGDGCSSDCFFEDGYECSGGDTDTPDTCYSVCGDGYIRQLENCDDGNSNNHDGCSSDCLEEVGFVCDGRQPTTCTEVCGDGKNYGKSECDDGNTKNGDGCSSTCEIEEGWKCTGGTIKSKDTCSKTPYVTQSLDQCQLFASQFFGTCIENAKEISEAPTFQNMLSMTSSCSNNYGGKCIGTKNANDECSWERKLCVTCFKDNETGYTKIRVQTNSLPDHCYFASKYTPITNLIDFEVAFSAQSNQEKLATVQTSTQYELDDLLCTNTWPGSSKQVSILSKYMYLAHSGNKLDQVVGIALNGVPIFAGTSELGLDAFAPKSYKGNSIKSVPVDLCLGNNDYTTFYHYYSNSPCILSSSYKSSISSGLCSADQTCSSTIKSYIVGAKSTALKTLQVVGITRSGHKIYGPYDANGQLWQPCDVDICNGIMINNEYAFVMTQFHPYVPACFMTGTKPLLTQSCSANPRICTGAAQSQGYLQLSLNYFLFIAIVINYLIN